MYTDDLQILLLRRVSPFDFWQSVTGSLDPGELPASAARRELFEETGLRDEGRLLDTGTSRLFTIDPRWLHRYPPGITENREYEWRYRLGKTVDIRMDQHEHSAWQWFGVDAAIDAVWSWTNREALEQLRDELA